MTRIRATCPDCGEIDLRPRDISVEVGYSSPDDASYSFHCPSCAETVTKPADTRVVRLLTSGGVPITYVPAAASAGHPESPSSAPPLTADDLIDFHNLLQSEHWFAELESLVR